MSSFCAIFFILYAVLGGIMVMGGKGNSSDILDSFHKRMHKLHLKSKDHYSFKRIHEQYDYQEYNNSYVIKEYGPNKVNKVRFLHIPKTGSSLGATFTHYCCAVNGVFIDVLRQFHSIIPGQVLGKVCDTVCFGAQPRSRNGDPWAHIPHRHAKDAGATIAMFRQPEARLASQLAYMQVLGPKLMVTFGFRRLDAYILFHLLAAQYDSALEHYLSLLNKPRSQEGPPLTELREDPYGLSANNTKDRVLKISDESFLSRARECVKLQTTLKVPASETGSIYNLSHSVNGLNNRLQQHFLGDTTAIEQYQLCGLRAIVHYPGLWGCQTRMVLGRNCFDTYALTQKDVREAKRRLSEEFLFVGITEQWNSSVTLFHTLYGGALHSDEVVHQRGAKGRARELQRLIRRAMAEEVGKDPWDTQLYEHALLLFDAALKKAGLYS